jgi:dihydrofolate reductase
MTRKIILGMMVSLDGFIEGPNREIGWHQVDAELHQHMNDDLRTRSTFLSGRVSHELMASFWPTADQDPDVEPEMAEFAGIWRDMPKIVYSRTLAHADWNTTIVREVVVDEVLALKEQPGGDLALGGADLAATFMRHDLIDEYRLFVNPVVLGGGKPLFQGTALDLKLVGHHVFGNGVAMLRYERAASTAAAASS